jgi:hypothetical protein
MEKLSHFIKTNYLPVLAGLFFYLLFIYYNAAGNSLCDCESTEKYNPNSGRTHSVNRFYHK